MSVNSTEKPLILLDPSPRTIDLIFSPGDKARLEQLGHVLWHDGSARADDEHIERHLADATALIGQTPMPAERLARAPRLRAIFNVEGNFQPNVDYVECHRRNIHVLSCAPAFAPAVAEMALGLALASARGIVTGDAAFRAGNEVYSGASNRDCVLFRDQTFGLIGCGNVGRAILPLLRPFTGSVLVHDPWIHDHVLEDLGVKPAGLDELLRAATVIFIIAAATNENQGAIREAEFALMRRGTIVVLVGRAGVVDFNALLDAAESGHVRAAIDVFPNEPLPQDHRARRSANTVLSAHRAGGLPATYREVGRMVVDDLELVLRGLPPQRMQRAIPEITSRIRSKPIAER